MITLNNLNMKKNVGSHARQHPPCSHHRWKLPNARESDVGGTKGTNRRRGRGFVEPVALRIRPFEYVEEKPLQQEVTGIPQNSMIFGIPWFLGWDDSPKINTVESKETVDWQHNVLLILVGGWTNPSKKKMQPSNWIISPGIGTNIKNIWNHQPGGYRDVHSKVVSTHRTGTHPFGTHLYQQAISRDSFHSWRTGIVWGVRYWGVLYPSWIHGI